jgi:hypothetical protein
MTRDRACSTASRRTAAACTCKVLESTEMSLLTRVSRFTLEFQPILNNMRRENSSPFALFSVVCTFYLFIHSTRWHHKFRTCSEVGADEVLAMIVRNSAGNGSRGRSGAGRFLSNFEPIMNVSEGTVKALRAGPYLRALLAACMDLDASICRAAFPSRCRVSKQENTDQLVSRANPSSMHTLCCLGSFMPLLASNSDRM